MILLTASGRAPLDPYLALLKPRGKLVCVSRPGKEGGGLTDSHYSLPTAPTPLHRAYQVSLPDKEERSQLYLHSAVRLERYAYTVRGTYVCYTALLTPRLLCLPGDLRACAGRLLPRPARRLR